MSVRCFLDFRFDNLELIGQEYSVWSTHGRVGILISDFFEYPNPFFTKLVSWYSVDIDLTPHDIDESAVDLALKKLGGFKERSPDVSKAGGSLVIGRSIPAAIVIDFTDYDQFGVCDKISQRFLEPLCGRGV